MELERMIHLEPKIEEWQKWIDFYILGDIDALITERYFFRELREIYKNNESLQDGSLKLFQYLAVTYGNSSAVRIRKQLKYRGNRRENISLAKILNDIAQCNDADLSQIGLSKTKADNDFKQLLDKGKTIETFVDKEIAHQDLRILRDDERPLFGELFEAIDLINDLFNSYYRTITNCNPFMQFYIVKQSPWKGVLKHPWIKESERPS
jgi:hypothetical protein